MLASPESARPGKSPIVDDIAVRIEDMDARLRAAEIATGDEKTARELRKAVEAIAKHNPKLDERLTNRIDVLADRMNTLATTVSTTASALAGKDGEIAGLRRELERGHAKVEALATEVRGNAGTTEIQELRRAIASLSAQRLEQAGDKHLERLSGKVDFLAERVDSLATTVATTAAGLAGREGDVSALRRRLDENVAQLTRVVGELGQAGGHDELASQVRSLSGAVATTTNDLARRQHETGELRAFVDDGHARLDSAVTELRQALGAAVTRVDGIESTAGAEALRSLEREVAEAGARIERLAAQLDSLGTTVEATAAANSEKEREIAGLGRRFEQASASVDALVNDLREVITTMPGTAVESTPLEGELAKLERRVADLSERLTSITGDRGAAAAELARRTAFWSTELSSIEARFSELSGRLDSLEHCDGAIVPAATTPAGDGRSRLEHRALELRMEHAEAAARENREAVLTQLERLASRIDWRLQRLETPSPPSPDEQAPPVEAQVVPIRATDP